jgi:hypothetical protein
MPRARIKYSGDSPAKVVGKLVAAAPEAMKDAVQEWHQEIMPQHFTRGAGPKYRYQKRKKRYQISKAKRVGHNIDLVFSGESEKRAKAGIRISTRRRGGNVVQARGAMDVPKYFYQYNKLHNAPDKANELTRTTAPEDARLSGTVERRMAERAIKVSGSGETVTVG